MIRERCSRVGAEALSRHSLSISWINVASGFSPSTPKLPSSVWQLAHLHDSIALLAAVQPVEHCLGLLEKIE
jgi:hypothetical protein